MRLDLHPEARAELRSAAPWYDEQRPGLGDEFIAEVSRPLIEFAHAFAAGSPRTEAAEAIGASVPEGGFFVFDWYRLRTLPYGVDR